MTLRAQSKTDYIKEVGGQAEETYRTHYIAETGERRWMLLRPEGQYWTEVIVTKTGVLAHGDITLVNFDRYSDTSDPKDVVRWMGHQEVGSGYAVEKAQLGTGAPAIFTREKSVALHDLTELQDEEGQSWKNKKILMVARQKIISGEDVMDVVRYIHDSNAELDIDSYGSIGHVPNSCFFFAHAALRRLHTLLST